MQSSDTTYRVYDFDRPENDGSFRELHLKEAIDVITIPQQDTIIKPIVKEINDNKITTFISNNFFTVEKWQVKESLKISNKNFKLFSVIDGSGTINGIEIKKGLGLIVTSLCNTIVIKDNLEIIVSYL